MAFPKCEDYRSGDKYMDTSGEIWKVDGTHSIINRVRVIKAWGSSGVLSALVLPEQLATWTYVPSDKDFYKQLKDLK